MSEQPRKSIRKMADDVAQSVAELMRQREATTNLAERKELNKRIKLMIDMETWFRSREGYE